MKFIPLVFLVVFIVFALLQINDPDPVQWMLVYFAAAFLSFLAWKGRLSRTVAFISAVLFAAGAVYQWPQHYEGITGNMVEHPFIELARESFGLLICAVVTIINFFISKKISGVEKS